MDLEEVNEFITKEEWLGYRYWWLICPECAWFAPFGSSPSGVEQDHPYSTRCDDCDTELLWEGMPHEIDTLLYSIRFKDPESNDRCGNGYGGFTSIKALEYIWSQNDITWWIKNKGNSL